ncbi:hypothetical protein Tco_0764368, partial [Tanacetum coccineum]
SILLLVVILPAGRMVSAGWSMVLLVVILPAGRMVSAGWSMVLLVVILPAGRLVSAGRTMILLVVIFSAGRLVSADRVYVPAVLILLVGWSMPLVTWILLVVSIPAGDAADEDNAAAHEAAGSSAEAHPGPHSPPVSPVRELTPERQPETEWVVPNPVSPVADWRPWPSVPAHSPIRDSTHEPASLPNPPTQTFIFEEPLAFGPEPRPAGYVDPDDIDSIIFGPQPRPSDFVDPTFVEPIIFGPQPRPDNYREPEDLDNPMEEIVDPRVKVETIPDSAASPPRPRRKHRGRAEDPYSTTSILPSLTGVWGV